MNRSNIVGSLIGLIVCMSVSFGLIYKKQNERIDKQDMHINKLKIRLDSVTVEYIRYKIDNPRIKE